MAEGRHDVQRGQSRVVIRPRGLDELLGPRNRLVLLDPVAKERCEKGDCRGSVEVATVGGPTKCLPQIGQFGPSHAWASRWFALSHNAITAGSRAAKYWACAVRAASAAPVRTSCSSANCRMVSSMENRVREDVGEATKSDLRTSASSMSRVAIRLPNCATAHAAAKSNPPAKTEQRFNSVSRQRRAGRRTTAPRGAAFGGAPARAVNPRAAGIGHRGGPVARSAVIDNMRDAANSIASGMPSKRRQISTTVLRRARQ